MKSCMSFQIYKIKKSSHLPSTYTTLQETLLWLQDLELEVAF